MTASTAGVAPLPGIRDLWRALHGPAVVLLAGIAVLGALFASEAAAAWRVWNDSTAYSHCFFVLPIAIYMAWERRGTMLATPVRPLPIAAVLALPFGLAWLVAERLGLMEGRQLVALSIVELLFLAVLGWRMFRALAAPLLYLYFLVPFGAFITPVLQDWTASFIRVGLTVLQIPFDMDGYLIEIPEGRFYVAEACAGLRFLIASIAFGVLYAVLMYRRPWKRAAFIVASILIPIVANWFRALGIVLAGHLFGSAQAVAADHVIYGWVFFSVVTLVLILAGLPFREDTSERAPPPAVGPAPGAAAFLPGAVAVLVLAALGPAIAAGFDRAARVALPTPHFAWTLPLGCVAGAPSPGAEPGSEVVRIACPQGILTATAQIFSPRVNPGAIGVALRRATDEATAEDLSYGTLAVPGSAMPRWRLTYASNPKPPVTRVTASALWVDGAPARGGLAGRFEMARNSILGTPEAPVLLTVAVVVPRPQLVPEEERAIQLFLATFLGVQTNLSAEVSRLAAAPR